MTLSADFVSGQPTTFRQLRRMMQDAGMQEGVVGSGDFATTQRGAGANMSVDVALGTAWIQVDTGTNMGLAHVLSDAVTNLAVTASNATNPRVDIATLRYNDAAIPAGSGNIPTLQVLAGTPTAGAQISNPTGANYRANAPALPNDSLWLADILVPATSTSVVNANIVDRRVSAVPSRTGRNMVTTSETRTNAAFGLMATPDRVSSVVLPTNGLMVIAYQATWQESVVAAAEAAIFIGANQLKYATPGLSGPGLQLAKIGTAAANTDSVLSTFFGGLTSRNLQAGGSAHLGDVTTGQIIGSGSQSSASTVIDQGGVCYAFAAAGTYDVTVQFRSTSGSLTVKDRKLWVWVL